MRKRTYKGIAIVFILVILLSGCVSNAPIKDSEDKYRNYYEIFVSSFYDSDQNGYGDIQGIIKKLDYLNDGKPNSGNDLGVDGIWLMPIMPSPTYHKYDVTDYQKIDPQYGTMEDFTELIAECDKRGINVIIDLVLNHTSTTHEWFQSAIKSIAIKPCGNDVCTSDPLCSEHNKYCGYYNFTTDKQGKYYNNGMPNGYYYQGVFWDGMPDLNLDNEELRKDLKTIGEFWIDKGVSGFRLDATTEFYDKNIEKNTAFLSWFYKEMQGYDKDIYMVGEAWTDGDTINQYYQSSGIDSYFNFPYAQADGLIVKTIRNQSGRLFSDSLQKLQEQLPTNSIPASFLSNHDNGRSAGYFMGNLTDQKLAASLYMLAPGNPFIYYGEEIGLKGSGVDENKRLPFLWSNKNTNGATNPPLNATMVNEDIIPLDEQIKDKNSLYNFYREIIKVRNSNPEIAKGKLTHIDVQNTAVSCFSLNYADRQVLVIHNLSDEEISIKLADFDVIKSELTGNLIADKGKVTIKNNTVTLPAKSTAIVRNTSYE